MSEKIIAREVPPSQVDFSFYFDNDGFKEVGGENCAVYIAETRRSSGYNADEYKGIQREMEAINDEADKEIWDTSNIRSVAAYLTQKTGVQWVVRSFHGYSQGDYCEVLFCPDHYTDDGITEFGKFWLGCGTEFEIDDTSGYYVIDQIRWKEGDVLRKALADQYGCKPEDLEVKLYIGEHTVADYKTME